MNVATTNAAVTDNNLHLDDVAVTDNNDVDNNNNSGLEGIPPYQV